MEEGKRKKEETFSLFDFRYPFSLFSLLAWKGEVEKNNGANEVPAVVGEREGIAIFEQTSLLFSQH